MTEKMLARVAVSSVPYAADRLYTYLVSDELIGCLLYTSPSPRD